MATPTGQTLTDQQKLDLIRATQMRMQKTLGIDPSKPFAENVDHMRAHPDAEIRRRYGNLGTAASTVDPVTRQRGLGEQTDLVAFAVRDIGAEAAKLDSYSRSKFIDDKYMKAQGFDDWMGPLKPGQVWRDDVDRESAHKVAELDARRRQDAQANKTQTDETPDDGTPEDEAPDDQAPEDEAPEEETPDAAKADPAQPARSFLSREQFLALPSLDRQIEEVNKLEAKAGSMGSDPKIERGSYAGERLAGVSGTRTTAAHFSSLPEGERAAQAYRHYYAAQEALEWGQKVISGQDPKAGSAAALAESLGRPAAGTSASTASGTDREPDTDSGDAPSSPRRTRSAQAQARRTPEERMARLDRLQDRVATAMADGGSSGWTAEQKTAAQSFVQADLSVLKNGDREERRALAAQAREMRELLRNDRIAPGENFAPRVIDRQMVEAPARESGERGANREQRLERLERLQERVRDVQSRGLSDGWTFEQQAMAQNFAIRDLRRDLQNGQRDDIRAEAQALRPLVRGLNAQTGQEAEVARTPANPRADFGTATFASGWNNKTRFPQAEPPAYQGRGVSVDVRPGGPSWNGSPGFGDRTDVPETQLPSYEVRIRQSAQPEFSNAATAAPPTVSPSRAYEPSAPVARHGNYDHHTDSGITWSGGPLAPQFSLYAAQTQQNPSVNSPDRNMLLVKDPLRDLSEEGGSPATRKPAGYQLG